MQWTIFIVSNVSRVDVEQQAFISHLLDSNMYVYAWPGALEWMFG